MSKDELKKHIERLHNGQGITCDEDRQKLPHFRQNHEKMRKKWNPKIDLFE